MSSLIRTLSRGNPSKSVTDLSYEHNVRSFDNYNLRRNRLIVGGIALAIGAYVTYNVLSNNQPRIEEPAEISESPQ